MPFQLSKENFLKLKKFSRDENAIGFFDSLACFLDKSVTLAISPFLSKALNEVLSDESTQSFDDLIRKYIGKIIKSCKAKKELTSFFCEFSKEILGVEVGEERFLGLEFSGYMNELVEKLGFNIDKYQCSRVAKDNKQIFSIKKIDEMTTLLFVDEDGEQLTGAQLLSKNSPVIQVVQNQDIDVPAVNEISLSVKAFVDALERGNLAEKLNAMIKKTEDEGHFFIGLQDLKDSIEMFSARAARLEDPEFSVGEARENLCHALSECFSVLCEQFKVVFEQVVKVPEINFSYYQAMSGELVHYQSLLSGTSSQVAAAHATLIELHAYLVGVNFVMYDKKPSVKAKEVLQQRSDAIQAISPASIELNAQIASKLTSESQFLVDSFLLAIDLLKKNGSIDLNLLELEKNTERAKKCVNTFLLVALNRVVDEVKEWTKKCKEAMETEENKKLFSNLRGSINTFLTMKMLAIESISQRKTNSDDVSSFFNACNALKQEFEMACAIADSLGEDIKLEVGAIELFIRFINLSYDTVSEYVNRAQKSIAEPKSLADAHTTLIALFESVSDFVSEVHRGEFNERIKELRLLVPTTLEFDPQLVEALLVNAVDLLTILTNVKELIPPESPAHVWLERNKKITEKCIQLIESCLTYFKEHVEKKSTIAAVENAKDDTKNEIFDRLTAWIEDCKMFLPADEYANPFPSLEDAINEFSLAQATKMSLDEHTDQSTVNEINKNFTIACDTLLYAFQMTCAIVGSYDLGIEQTPEFIDEFTRFIISTRDTNIRRAAPIANPAPKAYEVPENVDQISSTLQWIYINLLNAIAEQKKSVGYTSFELLAFETTLREKLSSMQGVDFKYDLPSLLEYANYLQSAIHDALKHFKLSIASNAQLLLGVCKRTLEGAVAINTARNHARKVYRLLSESPYFSREYERGLSKFIDNTERWIDENFKSGGQYEGLIHKFLSAIFSDANDKLDALLEANDSSCMLEQYFDIVHAINEFSRFAFGVEFVRCDSSGQRQNPAHLNEQGPSDQSAEASNLFAIEGNNTTGCEMGLPSFGFLDFAKEAEEKLGSAGSVLPAKTSEPFRLNIFDSPIFDLFDDLKSLTRKYEKEIKRLWEFQGEKCQKAIDAFLDAYALYKKLPKEVDADTANQMHSCLHWMHLCVTSYLDSMIKKTEKDGFFLLDLNCKCKRIKTALTELMCSVPSAEKMTEMTPDSQPGKTFAKKLIEEAGAERERRIAGNQSALFKPTKPAVTHSHPAIQSQQQPSRGFQRR